MRIVRGFSSLVGIQKRPPPPPSAWVEGPHEACKHFRQCNVLHTYSGLQIAGARGEFLEPLGHASCTL